MELLNLLTEMINDNDVIYIDILKEDEQIISDDSVIMSVPSKIKFMIIRICT